MVSIDFTKKWDLSDVVLKMRDSEELLYANKYILAAFSPFFKSLLLGDYAESNQDVVKLDGIDYYPMLEILQILHHVDRRFNEIYPLYSVPQLVLLWQTAHGYDIPLVQDLCKQQISTFSSVDALDAAIQCGLHQEKSEMLKRMKYADIETYLKKGVAEMVLSPADAMVIVEKRMEAERASQPSPPAPFEPRKCPFCPTGTARYSMGGYLQCDICTSCVRADHPLYN